MGEALDVLLAALIKTQVAVTNAEGEELRALLDAVGLPADSVPAM